jgi:hypothetical protein
LYPLTTGNTLKQPLLTLFGFCQALLDVFQQKVTNPIPVLRSATSAVPLTAELDEGFQDGRRLFVNQVGNAPEGFKNGARGSDVELLECLVDLAATDKVTIAHAG